MRAYVASMLASWIAPTTIADFRGTHLGRAPLARAGTAFAARPLLDWGVLDRVLAAGPDVIVCAKSERLALPAPRSISALRALFSRGIGLCIRHAERHDEGLRALAGALTDAVPGEPQVQIFATPGGTHGFGWHYDAEDVFIAQTIGAKRHFFRDNTIDPCPRRGAQPDFSCLRDETTPRLECTLLAGDFLYLPRAWWHAAHAIEDALSISIGLFPAEVAAGHERARASRDVRSR